MYKRIFVVAIIAAVVTALCIGCGLDTMRPPEVNGVVGDWLLVEGDTWWDDDHKLLMSFLPVESNSGFALMEINRYIGNGREFWIEGKFGPLTDGSNFYWRTSGDSVYVVEENDGGEYVGMKFMYSVSEDTITLIGDDYRMTFIRVNLENFKRSLGQVYSQDLALRSNPSWRRYESEDDYDYIYFGYDGGYFGVYYASDHVAWYTEGSSLFLVERDYGSIDDYIHFTQIITLDYQLTNGTLLLRPAGSSEWDVWTPRGRQQAFFE